MFMQNKYTRTYQAIIERARQSGRKKGDGTDYERHHIIPKSLGGSNDDGNLVYLTPKEHYTCHRLLIKMTNGKDRSKMCCALYFLQGPHKVHHPMYNARKYERDRMSARIEREHHPLYGKPVSEKQLARMKAQRGPTALFYGRRHSAETKEKMSIAKKGKNTGEMNSMFGKTHTQSTKRRLSEMNSGEKNPFYGKKHSEEFIQRNRGETHAMYGRKHSEKTREKIRKAVAGKQSGSANHKYGKPLTQEQIQRQRETMTGRKWFNDGTDQRLIPAGEPIEDGWVAGRIR